MNLLYAAFPISSKIPCSRADLPRSYLTPVISQQNINLVFLSHIIKETVCHVRKFVGWLDLGNLPVYLFSICNTAVPTSKPDYNNPKQPGGKVSMHISNKNEP